MTLLHIKGENKTEMENNHKKKAYFYCLIAMFGWGSLFIAAKLAYQAITGLTLLFLRYVIALAFLLFIYRKIPKPKLTKTDWKNLILIGVVGYCFSIALQLIGTNLVAASMASIINTITPVAIIVFAAPLLGEKASLKEGIGILVTVLGSVFIVGGAGGASAPLGIFLNFAGMAFWGFSSVLIRKSCANIDSIWVTIYGMFIAAVADIPFMAVDLAKSGLALSAFTPTVIAAILWIGLVPTAAANLFWNKALEELPAATCSLFYAFLPIISALLGILVLNEVLTIKFIIGSLIIILGMLIAVSGQKKSV